MLFPNLQNYLRKTFEPNTFAMPMLTGIRGVIKWLFDYLRNVLIVGFLLYLAIKTHSFTLKAIAIGACLLLAIYVWTYIDAVMFAPLHFFKGFLGRALNLILQIVIIMALTAGTGWVLTIVLFDVADSYLQ